jgi:hypothetical protein
VPSTASLSTVSSRSSKNCFIDGDHVAILVLRISDFRQRSLEGRKFIACAAVYSQIEYVFPYTLPVTAEIPRSRVLEKLTVEYLVKQFPPYMELEGSSSCSQEPATGPCHEPE